MMTITATPEIHRDRLRLRITDTASGAKVGYITVSRPGDCDPIGMPSLTFDEMMVDDERRCELLTAAAVAIEASQALWLDLVSQHGPEVGPTTVRLDAPQPDDLSFAGVDMMPAEAHPEQAAVAPCPGVETE